MSVSLMPVSVMPGESESGRGPGGVAGDVTGGCCDVAGAAEFHGADGKVAQG
jgi:hypothetical protein